MSPSRGNPLSPRTRPPPTLFLTGVPPLLNRSRQDPFTCFSPEGGASLKESLKLELSGFPASRLVMSTFS